jgi:hypothetical protein
MRDYKVFEAWANRFDHDSREWEDMGRDTVFIAGMNAARSEDAITLTIDTREDDAALAEKVRMALRMTGGHPIVVADSTNQQTPTIKGEAPAGISLDVTKLDQLRVFRDLLMGADIADVKQEYELDDIEYGEAIETGLEITNEVLKLALDPLAMEASFYCEGGKDTWVYRAMLAIEQLRPKPEQTPNS